MLGIILIIFAVFAVGASLAYRKFHKWQVDREYALKYPLHLAVLRANKDEAERLLEQGTKTNEFDDKGHTPLHWAVFGGYYDIADLLLKHGADVNAVATDGVSPLWRAEDFGLESITNLLIKHGGKSICR